AGEPPARQAVAGGPRAGHRPGTLRPPWRPVVPAAHPRHRRGRAM
ncbi:MAG: hypothetical protein AVDCRST_MAG65-1705, partial [uncultured Solirubrobacteraceae bacterium]